MIEFEGIVHQNAETICTERKYKLTMRTKNETKTKKNDLGISSSISGHQHNGNRLTILKNRT